MIFNDRQHAAQLLIERLKIYKSSDVVVLFIPRGAVAIGMTIAQALHCPLGMAPVRKVSSPLAPEFALGAADVEGNFYPEDDVMNLPAEQIKTWFKKSLEVIRFRDFRWRKILKPPTLKNKTVIVVDDGVATGATMRAALMWVRRKQPAEVVVAVPVSSTEGMSMMSRFADKVVCLFVPRSFAAVGEFYAHFDEVSDDDVCRFLEDARDRESGLSHG
jgi:putative phosphoribosyl transferase